MCLSSIESTQKPDKKVFRSYKVFRLPFPGTILYFPFGSLKRRGKFLVEVPLGKWIRSTPYDAARYTDGFHVFPKLEDAKDYGRSVTYSIVYEIDCRGLVINGTQEIIVDGVERLAECSVVKEIKVLTPVYGTYSF